MTLQKKLKNMRARLGLSQEDFAMQVGVPYRTYQDWELGARKPSAAAVRLIMLLIDDDEKLKKKVRGTP